MALNAVEQTVETPIEYQAEPQPQIVPVPPSQEFAIEQVGPHNVLVVRLLIQEPRPSSTGKSLLLATVNGPVGYNFGEGNGKPMRMTASITVPAK